MAAKKPAKKFDMCGHVFEKEGKKSSFCMNCGCDHRYIHQSYIRSINHTHIFETIFDESMKLVALYLMTSGISRILLND